MTEEWNIKGKKALITGGATGLGAAYAEAFLKNEAENVAILDVNETVGKKFAETLNKTYNDKIIFIKCDVGCEEEIKKAFQEVLNAFDRIDIIINNAGIMSDAPHIWRKASDVNWQGLLSFTMKGVEHMRKDEGGCGGTIVNISSTAAIATLGFLPVYSGSKAAVLHFGRCISSPEFNNDSGIRVLTICFGPTDTALLTELEARLFAPKITGESLAKMPVPKQRIECAVDAMLKMLREGAPGSIWLSTHSRPAKNITSAIDAAYLPLLALLKPEDNASN